MKRMHIHVGVADLDKSIAFYSALFGAQPVKTKPDYAKSMLDEPCVNFAISTRSGEIGLNHLGIQVDEESELADLRSRIETADMEATHEGETTCCYAKSDKSWVQDPAGIAWEAYRTMEDAQIFSAEKPQESASPCCAPATKPVKIGEKSSSGCCG